MLQQRVDIKMRMMMVAIGVFIVTGFLSFYHLDNVKVKGYQPHEIKMKKLFMKINYENIS